MVEIIWTRSALKDLRDIQHYISLDSKYYAKRYVSVLIHRVEILISYPLAGRVVPEKEDETIRELIEGNYRIFYKVINKEKVAILRVHHSSKQIK